MLSWRETGLKGWKAEPARLTDRGRQPPPGAVPAFKKKLVKCTDAPMHRQVERFLRVKKPAANERVEQRRKQNCHQEKKNELKISSL